MSKYIGLLLLTSSLFALPTHSPNRATYFHDEQSTFNACDPCFLWQEALNWRTSFCQDVVFNRYMGRRQNTRNISDIQQVAFSTSAGTITVNAADWFEFYALLGSTKFSITSPTRFNRTQGTLLFSPKLCWSIGMRGTAWMWHDLALGFKGQYFRTSPKLNAFYDYGGGQVTAFSNYEKPTYAEWDAACGLSYLIRGPAMMEFRPHIAAVTSWAKMGMRGNVFVNNGNTHTFLNLRDTKMWGYAFGLNWEIERTVAVGAEARFGDQTAMHFTAEVAF